MENKISGGEKVEALSSSVLGRSSLWTLKAAESNDRSRAETVSGSKELKYPGNRGKGDSVQLFATHGLLHARPPWPSPFPGVCPNSCPLSL